MSSDLDSMLDTISPSVGNSCSLTLPTFSDKVVHSLRLDSVDLDAMVAETAYHIMATGDLRTKGDYLDYCRRMHVAYPFISYPGATEWVSRTFEQF